MGSNYEKTHLDILKSAKKNFMENGFERSNLRKICKDANITTGAFYRHFEDKEAVFIEIVSSVLAELKKMYLESEKESYNILENSEIEKIWDVNQNGIMPFIEFIYDNYSEIKLLLLSSDGTKYENFLHDISEIETKKTLKYINAMRKKGYKVHDISEKEIHMIVQAYFSSVFEVVVHDYTKEDAIAYTKTLVKFFAPGWKNILSD